MWIDQLVAAGMDCEICHVKEQSQDKGRRKKGSSSSCGKSLNDELMDEMLSQSQMQEYSQTDEPSQATSQVWKPHEEDEEDEHEDGVLPKDIRVKRETTEERSPFRFELKCVKQEGGKEEEEDEDEEDLNNKTKH